MKELRNPIIEEVQNEIAEVAKMELGSDEYVKTVNGVNGLTDRAIKMQEVENESRRLDVEAEKLLIEKEKIDSDKKGNWIKVGGSVLVALLYAGVNIWAVKDNQRYENGGGMHTAEGGRAGLRNLLNLSGRAK